MAGQSLNQVLADGITNVSLVNGVFRVTLVQTQDGKEAQPVAQLLIPASQFSPFVNGLAKAGEQIASQIKDKSEAAEKAGKKEKK